MQRLSEALEASADAWEAVANKWNAEASGSDINPEWRSLAVWDARDAAYRLDAAARECRN